MTSRIGSANSALVQDEVLGEIIFVLNRQKPAGPNFLNSLGSLVEACVLHEDVFVLPGHTDSTLTSPGLGSIIEGSDFVASLLHNNALKRFPGSDTLEEYLSAVATDYTYADFLLNLRWTYESMNMEDSDSELWLWSIEDLIMRQAPELFEADVLTSVVRGQDTPVGPKAESLVNRGLPVRHLITLEGWNRQIRALQRIAQLTALNLYVVPAATPHQLGALSTINLKARFAYEQIESKLRALVDDRVGHAEFQCIATPPLTAIAVAKSKGDPKALAEAVMEVRHQFRELRHYLTGFESAWASANNRRERLRLQRDFEAALGKLVERDTRPRDRLFYKIWDVVKSPTRILQSLGDKLVAVGRDETIVGQVGGLSAFWRSALQAPLQSQVDLCSSIASSVAEDALWAAYARFAQLTDQSLVTNAWKGA